MREERVRLTGPTLEYAPEGCSCGVSQMLPSVGPDRSLSPPPIPPLPAFSSPWFEPEHTPLVDPEKLVVDNWEEPIREPLNILSIPSLFKR
jgi:hypothetical protein